MGDLYTMNKLSSASCIQKFKARSFMAYVNGRLDDNKEAKQNRNCTNNVDCLVVRHCHYPEISGI